MGAWTTAVDALQNDARKNWQNLVIGLGGLSNAALCGGRLVLDNGVLAFQRVAGPYVPIAGTFEEIPDPPPTLSALGAADGVYYIYAFMAGRILTLERSTTAWALDATYGYPIKTGDPTRTLVGLAEASGGQWFDTPQNRLVATWWNRIPRSINSMNGAFEVAINYTSLTELNTQIRCKVICWADEVLDVSLIGRGFIDTTGGRYDVNVALDSTTVGFFPNASVESYGIFRWGSYSARRTVVPGEGSHFITALGATYNLSVFAIMPAIGGGGGIGFTGVLR